MTQANSIFDIRITSIWRYQPTGIAIFAGVPLLKGQKSSAKRIIVVTAQTSNLQMKPQKGQHWEIAGKASKVIKVKTWNGFIQEQVHVNANRLRVTVPETGDNFKLFIEKSDDFKGVGPVIAGEVWEKFKREIYQILNDADIERLKLCNRVSGKIALSLIEGWKKYSNLKYLDWFADHNVPPDISSRVIMFHEEKSIKSIKKNPYKLITFGMSFKDVDELVKNKFSFSVKSIISKRSNTHRLICFCDDCFHKYEYIGENDYRRLSAAVEMSLYKEVEKGHTVSSYSVLQPAVKKLLKSKELTDLALKSAHDNRAFIIEVNNNKKTYHPTGMWVQEKVVALRLLKLASKSIDSVDYFDDVINEATSDLPDPLTEKQRCSVLNSLKYNISAVTGGAGTGKTTAIRTIIKAHISLDYVIYPMALAGRAAKRIRESTGFYATTIARFLKNEDLNPDTKILIAIDEASMIDISTMYRLVTHTQPNFKFLLVGDTAQLPPIGAGLVLHDIVKAGTLPVCELDIVKRQCGSTKIPEYTENIKNGIIPKQLSTGNIRFHEVLSDEIDSKVAELYQQSQDDTQIVSAIYAKRGGIDALNGLCQQLCNPNGKQLIAEQFCKQRGLSIRVNDPVIFIENNYKLDIQNGTLGHLLLAEQTETGVGVVKLDDDREIELTSDLLDSIRLSYCISLHKAQGSQFKRVIVPITEAEMVDRCWIYTALTRAEVQIEIVGSAGMFKRAISRVAKSSLRNTYLYKLLKNSY